MTFTFAPLFFIGKYNSGKKGGNFENKIVEILLCYQSGTMSPKKRWKRVKKKIFGPREKKGGEWGGEKDYSFEFEYTYLGEVFFFLGF